MHESLFLKRVCGRVAAGKGGTARGQEVERKAAVVRKVSTTEQNCAFPKEENSLKSFLSMHRAQAFREAALSPASTPVLEWVHDAPQTAKALTLDHLPRLAEQCTKITCLLAVYLNRLRAQWLVAILAIIYGTSLLMCKDPL